MNFQKNVSIGIGVILSLALLGCAGSSEEEVGDFNKPALYWYQEIATNITRGNLDKADAFYISLKSEHMRSPLMPTALMMLAHAHMNKEEYLLANYYLDEYNKRYGEKTSREYTEFMKLKSFLFWVSKMSIKTKN
ncbi:MAG: outer membrane protein assembly factor BamD [Sulfurovum sp.]|nr:outer membrane protein assembly factor BamD [Sulfurovum sp.]